MFDQLIDRWWIVATRGIAAVVFGVAAFAAPEKTLGFLVSLFGFFAFADGIFTMGAGLSLNWLTLFSEGVMGIVVGLITLFFPALTAIWFDEFIVAWAFVTGALELLGAYNLRQLVKGPMVRGEWLLAGSGVLSIAFGGLVVTQTAASPSFIVIVGGYALFSGVLLLALSLNIRTWPRLASTAA